MQNPTEIWRAIPGYEGAYEVSDRGRVRSLTRHITQAGRRGTIYTKTVMGRYLSPGRMNKYGHVTVSLGRRNSQTVHSLVLIAFEGPRPRGYDSLHLNGDGGDNRLENLRWGSRTENNIDSSQLDRRKLKKAQVTYIYQHQGSHDAAEALAERFNCCTSQIYNIWKQKHWSHVTNCLSYRL